MNSKSDMGFMCVVIVLCITLLGYLIYNYESPGDGDLVYNLENKTPGVVYCDRFRDKAMVHNASGVDRYDPEIGLILKSGGIETRDCEFVKNGEYPIKFAHEVIRKDNRQSYNQKQREKQNEK